MSFNSVQFLLFFPLVTSLYFVLPHRLRAILLLLASYGFYMAWRPEFVILILGLTLVDYCAGLLIGRARGKARRLRFLLISLAANLGILFFFKYFNFFNDSLRGLFGILGQEYPIRALDIILPLGISFHTFQTMAYTIEVYMGRQKPEKNLLMFALYVAYFPQLVAGPIERPANLLPQFRARVSFDYERVTSGLKLMLWGMFKKVVIADNLAIFVDRVYNHPREFGGISLIIATVFFAFQIYCDFSGYTDIAIGAAQVMGHRLMENFRRPYFSKSVPEFWRRWHISLSGWFRDYVYIPLGGSRVAVSRRYANLAAVFLLSGLWHGANWTFVVWGALHGFFMVMSLATSTWRAAACRFVGLERFPALLKALQVATTFSLVCFAWIFFRANNIHDAWYIATHLFAGWGQALDFSGLKYAVSMGMGLRNLALPAFAIGLMEAAHVAQRRGSVRGAIARWPVYVRWPVYLAMIMMVLNLGVPYEIPFIYFQF